MNAATREAFGQALAELGDLNPNIVSLDADLSCTTKSGTFAAKYPDRFFNMGIAEADLMATAAGLATCDKIPFASTFAVFATCRALDQIRNSICYPSLNVKVVGTHAGPSCGEDGGSHQAVEDIAIMRSLPNMVVVVPADDVEAKRTVYAAADYFGPMYLRFARLASPTVHEEDGSAVCEVVTERCPVPVRRIGMPDIFGKSGPGAALLDEFGLTADHIIEEVHDLR